MTDDPRHRLDDLGGTEVPAPDPVFADRLEQRLRSVATVSPTPAAPPPRRGRWTGLVLRPGFAVAAIALVGIVGAAWFARDDSPTEVLALTAANSSSVVLPDGTELVAVPGLEIPDGTIIEVGTDGSVTIDGSEYGAGSVLEITGGQVRLTTGRPGGEPGDQPSAVTAVVTDRPPTTDRPTDGTSVPTEPAASPTTATPPTSAVDRPPTTRPTPTTSLTTAPVSPAVTLEAVALSDNRWRLMWAVTSDTGIIGWVIRGSAGNPAPDPRTEQGRQVAALRAPESRELVVSPPGDAAEVAYVIEARSRDGLLATSNTVILVPTSD